MQRMWGCRGCGGWGAPIGWRLQAPATGTPRSSLGALAQPSPPHTLSGLLCGNQVVPGPPGEKGVMVQFPQSSQGAMGAQVEREPREDGALLTVTLDRGKPRGGMLLLGCSRAGQGLARGELTEAGVGQPWPHCHAIISLMSPLRSPPLCAHLQAASRACS